jgi:virginiamycin A acetyltransferase
MILLRKLVWRILGFDYQMMLDKTDFTLLKNDSYTKIGERTYDNGAKVWRWTDAPLTIGNYCSIANNVNFIINKGNHKMSSITNFPIANNVFKNENTINGIDKKTFFSKFKQKEGITIGNDVWIGMGAYIMPGVTIGNGATIAANSVVTKDISDYTVEAGVPANIIKVKYEVETINKLNAIAWWDWEEENIKNRIIYFHKSINEFVNRFSK